MRKFIPVIILAILSALIVRINIWGSGGDSYYELLRIGWTDGTGDSQDSLELIGVPDGEDSYLVIGFHAAGIPVAPTGFHIVSITQTTLTVAWQTTDLVGTHSQLTHRDDTYPPTPTDGTMDYNGEVTSYTVENLTPGTTYYFGVWGETGGVFSTASATLIATTHAGWEEPDDPVKITDTTTTTTLANSPMGGFIDFMVQYSHMPEKGVGLLGYMSLVLFAMVGIAIYNKSVAVTIIFSAAALLLGINLGVLAPVFLFIAIIAGVAIGILRGGQPSGG